MTSRQLTAVAFKVIALYICYTAFVYIPLYFRSTLFYLGDKFWSTISLAVSICIGGIVAWLALKFAKSLAKDICNAEQDAIVTQVDKAQLEQVLFRLLGLYVFATHLRPLVDVYILFKAYEVTGASPDFKSYQFSFIAELILIGFAISFILKPRFWQEKFKSWDSKKMNTKTEAASN